MCVCVCVCVLCVCMCVCVCVSLFYLLSVPLYACVTPHFFKKKQKNVCVCVCVVFFSACLFSVSPLCLMRALL